MSETTSDSKSAEARAEESHSGIERYLHFSLGKEKYAVPLLLVREVIAPPEVTPMPFTPPHFLGIMNLRGQVISVMDLRTKFGIKPQTSSETAVIIYDLAQYRFGLVVDSINSVLSVPVNEISIDSGALAGPRVNYMKGIYTHQNELVVLLDIEKVLDVTDRAVAAQKITDKAKANAA